MRDREISIAACERWLLYHTSMRQALPAPARERGASAIPSSASGIHVARVALCYDRGSARDNRGSLQRLYCCSRMKFSGLGGETLVGAARHRARVEIIKVIEKANFRWTPRN